MAAAAGIAGQLNALGVISYFAGVVGQQLTAASLGWQPVFALLSLVYFGLHYMFASQTAHVGALYSAFLAMMLSAGASCGANDQGSRIGHQVFSFVIMASSPTLLRAETLCFSITPMGCHPHTHRA